jgi:hypothetical protein
VGANEGGGLTVGCADTGLAKTSLEIAIVGSDPKTLGATVGAIVAWTAWKLVIKSAPIVK